MYLIECDHITIKKFFQIIPKRYYPTNPRTFSFLTFSPSLTQHPPYQSQMRGKARRVKVIINKTENYCLPIDPAHLIHKGKDKADVRIGIGIHNKILDLASKRGSNIQLLSHKTYRFNLVETKIPPSLVQISQSSLPVP